MSEASKAFQPEWVARLFSRFQAIYGNRATTMWAAADPLEVRQVWSDELARFDADDVRLALAAVMTAYPDYPPTLPQFVGLCMDARKRRAQEAPKLPDSRSPMPEHVRAQLEKFLDKSKPRKAGVFRIDEPGNA